MDRNRQKPLPVLINPFAAWTEFTLRMWGFRRSGEPSSVPARPVAVAVIPPSDAPRVKAPAAAPVTNAKRKPAKRAAGRRKSASKKVKARARRASRRAAR